jgi:hypothetical protein
MELQTIHTRTTWNDAAERINHNNLKIATELAKLGASTYKNKGYFATAESLVNAYPTASAGSIAYVGSSYPYAIYVWNGSWVDSGETGGDESVPLGDYYTKEETARVVEDYHTVLTQEEYDNLGSYEDKLYFCTED